MPALFSARLLRLSVNIKYTHLSSIDKLQQGLKLGLLDIPEVDERVLGRQAGEELVEVWRTCGQYQAVGWVAATITKQCHIHQLVLQHHHHHHSDPLSTFPKLTNHNLSLILLQPYTSTHLSQLIMTYVG